MRTRTIEANGLTFTIDEAGEGGRPFLLMHGFTGSRLDFVDHLDRLAELGFHAVSPDARGHGASDQPAGSDQYSIDIWASDVVAIIEALGWSRCVLLGHSVGGMAAQIVVVDRPELVEALILMDTTHAGIPGLQSEMMPLAFEVIDEGGMAALGEVMREMGGALGATEAAKALAERDPAREAAGWVRFAELSPDMWKAMAPLAVENPDRLAGLAAVSVPTLVLVGDQDIPFIAGSEAMAEVIPGAQLVELPDSGHSPQVENPGPWWDAVSGFLAQLPAPA